MGDSDSEHEVCHVRWYGLGKNRYFEQGVGFRFCEVCKDGLDWKSGFHLLEFPVDMHFNHASHHQKSRNAFPLGTVKM